MDLQSLSKCIDSYKKRKNWVLLLALFGASSYGAYRVYHLPSVTRKRWRLLKLLTALFDMIELVSDSAETIGVVSKDLREFLKSDSDEIPKSLIQVSKLAKSEEFCDSLTRVTEALTVGILRGCNNSEISNEGGGGSISFTDQVMDKVFSNAGTGFVSVVAGSFARNLALGMYSGGETVGSLNGSTRVSVLNDRLDLPSVPKWVSVICSDKCKELMANCTQVFVSTAVAVFLEKTMHINTYDEIFSGLTNPSHESKMKDILVSVCNGAVDTLVKTSHRVLTSKDKESNPHSYSCSSARHVDPESMNRCEFDNGEKMAMHLEDRRVSDSIQGAGFGSITKSTLSVPSNQRFVFNVTGRVTFETFRSLVEFLHWKVSDGLRKGSYVVHDRVVDKGLQVVKYFGFRSYVFVTICLALFLHIICGTRPLLPA